MTTLEDQVIPSIDKLPAHPQERGTPAQFAKLFELYLDAAYSPAGTHSEGRQTLVASIATELKKRQVESVLDCACGSGFPVLDLRVTTLDQDLTIHCADADPLMVDALRTRANTLFGVEAPQRLQELVPPLGQGKRWPDAQPMVLDWSDLDHIDRQYDYVMCRGNSLVYASTWSGGRNVASPELAMSLLDKMVARVRPGGYLHIDAPRRQSQVGHQLPIQYLGRSPVAIKEKVRPGENGRIWTVEFAVANHQTPTRFHFERHSTLLTIRQVAAHLESLGFEDTGLVNLAGERPGFAVVIAKKPT